MYIATSMKSHHGRFLLGPFLSILRVAVVARVFVIVGTLRCGWNRCHKASEQSDSGYIFPRVTNETFVKHCSSFVVYSNLPCHRSHWTLRLYNTSNAKAWQETRRRQRRSIEFGRREANRLTLGHLLRNNQDVCSFPRDHWPRQWRCVTRGGSRLRAINACRMERYPEAESLHDPSSGTKSRGTFLPAGKMLYTGY